MASNEAQTEAKRVAEKIDRALGRLRRSLSTWLDRPSAPSSQLFSAAKELFSAIMGVLNSTIQEVIALALLFVTVLT
jgi:separase